jgi:hypothetical protein
MISGTKVTGVTFQAVLAHHPTPRRDATQLLEGRGGWRRRQDALFVPVEQPRGVGDTSAASGYILCVSTMNTLSTQLTLSRNAISWYRT